MFSHRLTYASAVVGVLIASAVLVLLYQGLDGSGMQILADPVEWLRAADPGLISETLATATAVMLAILGIAITVVAIVVELAANRYNHRITGLFIREPVNIAVMTYLVVATIVSYWAAVTSSAPVEQAAVPYAGFLLTILLVTVSLLIILPYFAFVISFVSPLNMIRKIQFVAESDMRKALRSSESSLVTNVSEAVDELHDVVRSAMELSDRSIAMCGIDALADLISFYQDIREEMPKEWFRIGEIVVNDPDFISLAPEAISEIEREGTWFEIKVLRQYLMMMMLSSVQMRDIAQLIAINTRNIAIASVTANRSLYGVTIRCFNSYLRSTINARDLRTAYYVLNQYRLVAESIDSEEDAHLVVEVAAFIQYYGQLAYNQGQAFVLEVAAYDVMRLLENSVETQSANLDELLDLLLGFDHKIQNNSSDDSLLGVRRAQVQAATMLLEYGDVKRAGKIAADLAGENLKYLNRVRQELESETRSQYWELTDRGITFGYLEPRRRAFLAQLFEMLN